MLDINIESKKFNCSMRLNERVTVINGDSGRGKTLFANALVDKSGAYKVSLSDSKFEPVLVRGDNWRVVLNGIISQAETMLVIVDDDDVACRVEFAKLCSQVVNCYFIFILRTKRFESLGNIGLSAREVYDFVGEGKNHYLVRRNQIEK